MPAGQGESHPSCPETFCDDLTDYRTNKAKEMAMKSLFEEMGGTYTLAEDGMYYPDITLQEDEKPRYGKYGRLRRDYLKEHRQGLYMELLMEGKLIKHLNEIDEAAHDRVELIVRQMAERQGIDEELKACEQMTWVRQMNNCKNTAEEIVLNELVYN